MDERGFVEALATAEPEAFVGWSTSHDLQDDDPLPYLGPRTRLLYNGEL